MTSSSGSMRLSHGMARCSSTVNRVSQGNPTFTFPFFNTKYKANLQILKRSSAIMVGYLMWKKDWAYEEAQSFVKKRRGVSSPNTGFIYQLLFLEKRLHELKRETRY